MAKKFHSTIEAYPLAPRSNLSERLGFDPGFTIRPAMLAQLREEEAREKASAETTLLQAFSVASAAFANFAALARKSRAEKAIPVFVSIAGLYR